MGTVGNTIAKGCYPLIHSPFYRASTMISLSFSASPTSFLHLVRSDPVHSLRPIVNLITFLGLTFL